MSSSGLTLGSPQRLWKRRDRDHNEGMDKKDRRIAELETLLRNALERIVELERRLGLNSTNSSKPPSSDWFRKKPSPKSLRIKGQNPTGGQKGHKGHTLDRIETPDKIVIHGVDSCRSCQKSLADIPVSKRTSRQVKDIPQPLIELTEHQVETKICSCGCVNTGLFPERVTAPVQYGERISALAVYLSVQQLIPEDRLQTLFADVFDLNIATATLFMITGNPISKCLMSCTRSAMRTFYENSKL